MRGRHRRRRGASGFLPGGVWRGGVLFILFIFSRMLRNASHEAVAWNP
jgi:hypothetical protein